MDNTTIRRDFFFFAAMMFSDEAPSFPVDRGGQHGGDWSHLPKFILYYLLKFLNIRIHTPILRAVCRSWRNSLPISQIPKLPLGFDAPTLPPSPLPVLLYYNRFYLISPLSESHSPWIVRVADFTQYLDRNNFQLKNPIDGSEYFHPQPPLKGTFDFLGCKVTEIASCFSLRGGAPSLFNFQLKCLSEKMAGNWNLNSVKMISVLAKLTAENGGGLVFLEIGRLEWVKVKEMVTSDVEERRILRKFDNIGDIVCYDGEFYAFDVGLWKVGVIDTSDIDIDDTPSIEFIDGPKGVNPVVIQGVQFAKVDGILYAMKGVYFVPSKDGLYLVFEMSGFDEGIKEKLIVYELDEDEWEWNKVESIGQQIFFIGMDVAFSTPAELLPKWKAGSICLFTGLSRALLLDRFVEVGRGEMPVGLEMLDNLKYPKYLKGFRVYNMEEEERGIVPFEELSKEVYMGLFFPPPPWVKWTCPMLDDVEVKLENLKVGAAYTAGVKDGGNAAAGTHILEEVE
ncbi:F-box protein At2g17036-like [Silene latifolia]|uniref:F-box protein At2g17036-like n=1 Tax=Silene latifolia TaxID=37657 RepID=UPI003D77D7B3